MGIRKETSQNRKENKNNMANKFEIGSSEYSFPTQAKEHYSEEELDQKKDMYDAIEYDEGIAPDQYQSKKEISDEAKELIKMRKEREKADQKRGAGLLGFIRNLAA